MSKPESMFSCDWPGCEVEYPAFEPLRGLEEFGVRAGRAMAEDDGWFGNDAEDVDYCPEHAERGRQMWALSPQEKDCGGCGGRIFWTNETPEPTGDHCANCPPWTCQDCGQLDGSLPGGPRCSCWLSLEDMPLADIKAIFAADAEASDGATLGV